MGDNNKKPVFDDPLIIRYRGQYDYDGLLSLLRGFYKNMKIDIKEPKFKYKMKGSGAEVEFKFEGDRKVTHYVKVHLEIEGHLWNVKPKEVVIGGHKVMRTDGKLELWLNAFYEHDFAGKFGDKKFQKWMKKHIEDPEVGLQYGDLKSAGKSFLQKKLWELDAKIKKFLSMECY
ncbi:MAG: hypothetical protein ACQESE_02995 [Nanobdellota archaeon]